jgi:hypothetical protein
MTSFLRASSKDKKFTRFPCDKKTQAEGAAENSAGKMQNAAGGVKETVKEWANR